MHPMSGTLDFDQAYGAFTTGGAGLMVMDAEAAGSSITPDPLTDRRRRAAAISPFLGIGFVPDWGIPSPRTP